MARQQITFYRSFWVAIQKLKKKEDRLSILEAIVAYGMDEEIRPMTDAAEGIFVLVQPTLDAANKKSKGRTEQDRGNKEDSHNEVKTSRPEQDISKIPARPSQDTGKEKEKEVEGEVEGEVEVEKEKEVEKESYTLPIPPSAPKKPVLHPLGDDDGFERFWAAYPKKSGDIREACRLYLDAIDGGATLEQMLKALEWQKSQPSWTDQGGRYIPSPAKWLQNRAWTQTQIKAKAQPQGNDLPDYDSPSRAEMDRMQRLLDQMDASATAKAKASYDGKAWYCGACLTTLSGKPEKCPKCGAKLVYREDDKNNDGSPT